MVSDKGVKQDYCFLPSGSTAGASVVFIPVGAAHAHNGLALARTVSEHALSRGHDIRFEEVEVLDRSQRYHPRLTREAIEIFNHENIINRKEEIILLDPEWKRTLRQTSCAPNFCITVLTVRESLHSLISWMVTC